MLEHRYIYKPSKGKDFYRDTLEYFEYDASNNKAFKKRCKDLYYNDDNEISYSICKMLSFKNRNNHPKT